MNRWETDISILEEGDIYFFYKPRRNVIRVTGMGDVSRFYMVLKPNTKSERYIILGNKSMPRVNAKNDTGWGFVEMVGGRGFATKRSYSLTSKKTSRPAGEGVYSIVTHRDHSHLLYSLELPRKLGKVQKDLDISKEGNYIFLNRPTKIAPANPDTPFSNFSCVTIDQLNMRGTEILLIGVGADVGRLGLKVQKDRETLPSSDIVNNLGLDTTRHPTNSLVSGEWI